MKEVRGSRKEASNLSSITKVTRAEGLKSKKEMRRKEKEGVEVVSLRFVSFRFVWVGFGVGVASWCGLRNEKLVKK